jgi:indoleamine 2,3-dioxygenase
MLKAEDYDVDPELGFLPSRCGELPASCEQWSKLCHDIPKLTDTDLEKAVNQLLEFPIDDLVDKFTLRAGYCVLSFIIHAYVWKRGENNPRLIIPSQLAVPYCNICNKLGIAAIITHAAVDLYNWRLRDVNSPFTLENLEVNYKFTEYEDESWFYKIHIMMERIGGSALGPVVQLANSAPSLAENRSEDTDNKIRSLLGKLQTCIKEISALIGRMQEHCNPKIFFDCFRPYLTGWKGMFYQDVGYFNYTGGSAAQSSLIQAFDKILGIKHKDEYAQKFLADMLNYMPEKHRSFLDKLEERNIKPYITNYATHDTIVAYNSCLDSLRELRKIHMGLARQYVIKRIQEKTGNYNEENAIGTGGTQIREFLNATIKETKENKI